MTWINPQLFYRSIQFHGVLENSKIGLHHLSRLGILKVDATFKIRRHLTSIDKQQGISGTT